MNKFVSRLTIIEDDCRECIASLNYKDDKNDVTHAEYNVGRTIFLKIGFWEHRTVRWYEKRSQLKTWPNYSKSTTIKNGKRNKVLM